MIPSLILLGLLLGRWWWLALPVAAAGWPILLVTTGAMDAGPGLLAASGLAVLNTGAGVAVHQVVLHLVRRLRPTTDGPTRGR
ncbi:hypothetical protein [Micromonospora sp. MA102]|uniref:hypothetical protein n=1 Tax=Micromonospora sp. MA102 TaxID=2952755 RepID=UPI0021C7B168|nr:hypothetical protein [Micromonospora sp. MA102]